MPAIRFRYGYAQYEIETDHDFEQSPTHLVDVPGAGIVHVSKSGLTGEWTPVWIGTAVETATRRPDFQ